MNKLFVLACVGVVGFMAGKLWEAQNAGKKA